MVFSQKTSATSSIESKYTAIEEIEDLENVSTYTEDRVNNLQSVSIIGVTTLETTFICINCKKTLPCDPSETTTNCENCETKQKLRSHKTSAKVFIEDSTGHQHALRAYTEILSHIVHGSPITPEALLDAPPFNVAYNEYHVITDVSHE